MIYEFKKKVVLDFNVLVTLKYLELGFKRVSKRNIYISLTL